jgi:sugar phosphate isomerase/epimerase
VLELTPPEAVRLAAKVGYDALGFRLHSIVPGGAAYLLGDASMLRETRSALSATGMEVLDVDLVRFEPETSVQDLTPLVETAAALGAMTILTVSGDPVEDRLIANFSRFCELARSYDLSVELEFMPWTEAPDLAAATRVLSAAQQPNAGVLVDPLHFFRTDGAPADIKAIPRSWLHYVQICDAPARRPGSIDEMIFTARSERQFPGEGGLDLVEFIRAFPGDLPIAVETPNGSLGLTPEQRAARGLSGAKKIVALAEATEVAGPANS